jgi:hypothetical protein
LGDFCAFPLIGDEAADEWGTRSQANPIFPSTDLEEAPRLNLLDRVVANPLGALVVLTVAAFLEAWGDSFFQVGFYRTSGIGRFFALVAGAAVLATYGSVVNIPRWDFGRLLGAYVVLFFLMAQILNRVRFGQSPTLSIYLGGALIVAGGFVVVLGKS